MVKNDNNKNNGMIPSTWGPSLWHFLHTVSFNYPETPRKKHIEKYFQLVNILKYTLPCKLCRDNFEANLEKMNFYEKKNEYLQSRSSFSKFIYDLHNLVNEDTGKGKRSISLTRVKRKYEKYRYKEGSMNNNKQCKVIEIIK